MVVAPITLRARHSKGFTIVELLIVIVVIAILAAITIVSYNGIQQQARTAGALAAVDAYEKALRMYYTENNAYPAASTQTCLGSNYPATSHIDENICLSYKLSDGSTLQMLHATGAIDSQLTSYLGTTIRVDPTEYQRESAGNYQYARGLQYQAMQSGGVWTARLTYAIGATDTCGRGTLQSTPGWTGFQYCALELSGS